MMARPRLGRDVSPAPPRHRRPPRRASGLMMRASMTCSPPMPPAPAQCALLRDAEDPSRLVAGGGALAIGATGGQWRGRMDASRPIPHRLSGRAEPAGHRARLQLFGKRSKWCAKACWTSARTAPSPPLAAPPRYAGDAAVTRAAPASTCSTPAPGRARSRFGARHARGGGVLFASPLPVDAATIARHVPARHGYRGADGYALRRFMPGAMGSMWCGCPGDGCCARPPISPKWRRRSGPRTAQALARRDRGAGHRRLSPAGDPRRDRGHSRCLHLQGHAGRSLGGPAGFACADAAARRAGPVTYGTTPPSWCISAWTPSMTCRASRK